MEYTVMVADEISSLPEVTKKLSTSCKYSVVYKEEYFILVFDHMKLYFEFDEYSMRNILYDMVIDEEHSIPSLYVSRCVNRSWLSTYGENVLTSDYDFETYREFMNTCYTDKKQYLIVTDHVSALYITFYLSRQIIAKNLKDLASVTSLFENDYEATLSFAYHLYGKGGELSAKKFKEMKMHEEFFGLHGEDIWYLEDKYEYPSSLYSSVLPTHVNDDIVVARLVRPVVTDSTKILMVTPSK